MGLKKESEEDPLERENDVCLSRTSDLTQVGKHISNARTSKQPDRWKERTENIRASQGLDDRPFCHAHTVLQHIVLQKATWTKQKHAHTREKGDFSAPLLAKRPMNVVYLPKIIRKEKQWQKRKTGSIRDTS